MLLKRFYWFLLFFCHKNKAFAINEVAFLGVKGLRFDIDGVLLDSIVKGSTYNNDNNTFNISAQRVNVNAAADEYDDDDYDDDVDEEAPTASLT
eukprot:Pgem_evm2s2555